MLAKFTHENVDFDAPHFDFHESYEDRVTLLMKDISAYGSTVKESNKISHKLREFLMVKNFEEKYPSLPRAHWKSEREAMIC
jgi:hypothetical protein